MPIVTKYRERNDIDFRLIESQEDIFTTLVSERPKLKPIFEKQAAWMEEFYVLRAAGGDVR